MGGEGGFRSGRRNRMPGLGSPGFWGLAVLLALVLRIVGLQLDQLWPGLPTWGRTLVIFVVTGTVGEFYVYHRWPQLRMSPADSRDISLGYLLIAGAVAAIVAGIDFLAAVALPPAPLAWVAYLSLILLDASYRW